MARVKRGVVAKARHKKVMDQAKGYYGARARSIGREASRHQGRPIRLPRSAPEKAAVSRALDYADQCGSAYARAVLQPPHHGLNRAEIEVDRKVLADIAVHDQAAFAAIAEAAKEALAS